MIQLARNHRQAIERHGEQTYPHECCGFLIGREQDGVKTVEEILRAGNSRDDSPENRYLIDPLEFVKAQRRSSVAGLDIIGFYHSHPDVAARPSQFDRDHAWPVYSYLILSVRQGVAKELFSWVVPDESQPFIEEPIGIAPG